jgi:hypothetical protein
MSSTELGRHMPGVLESAFSFFAQKPAMGALPTVRAATDPTVKGGQYYGPDGIGEVAGHPKVVSSSQQSHDESIQDRLWNVSQELTGVTYPV